MKRPLLYYAISLFIGCLSTYTLFQNALVGAVIAASFFAIFFFTLDKKFFIISMLFFFIGIVTFTMYFNIQVPSSVDIRVIQKKGYYYLADYKGRKIILTGKVGNIEEGERLIAYGKFESNKEFSRGIIGKYKIENKVICKKDFIYYLYDIKKTIYIKYKESLGEEKAALVMSLCYGDAEYLSKSQKSEFQEMGVFHAISVSGFHMAIIYKVLENIVGIRFSILISFIYILFTGIQASTIRAFIMIFVFKCAKMVFKNYDSISSLSFSALIILFIKPYYIMDIGFMLSFSATLGILLYYKKFLRIMYKLPKMLNESLSITLSSQVFSIPYTAFTIQNFSGGFILGNLVLLPMYSAIVILGNTALLVYSMKPIFNFLSMGLNLILTAIQGANYLILKLCPPVSYFGYLDGIALIMIYVSFALYKCGYKKYKWLPVFVLSTMLCENYSFIPKIYYMEFSKGEAIVIEHKWDKILVCNYEQSSAKEVMNLKEDMKINKVITNPEKNFIIPFGDTLQVSVIPYYKDKSINVGIYSGDKKIMLISNSIKKEDISVFNTYDVIKLPQNEMTINPTENMYSEYKDNVHLYAIMFNRVIKMY